MMDTRRYLWLTCLLLILGLGACEGGSGSSGFDIHSEDAVIQAALADQRCVQHESLTICPAAEAGATPSSPATSTPTPGSVAPGSTPTPNNASTPGQLPTATASVTPSAATTRTPSRTPTATATPTSGAQQVEIAIDLRAPVLCAPVQGGGCAFVLPFAVSGFPPGATFRVAVRTVNPNGRWVISDVLTPTGPAPSTFEAPVDVSVPVSSCCGGTAQAAVLVFYHPLVGVPAEVDELIETGADAAFVSEPFVVQTG
jgi:hypothetical protein